MIQVKDRLIRGEQKIERFPKVPWELANQFRKDRWQIISFKKNFNSLNCSSREDCVTVSPYEKRKSRTAGAAHNRHFNLGLLKDYFFVWKKNLKKFIVLQLKFTKKIWQNLNVCFVLKKRHPSKNALNLYGTLLFGKKTPNKRESIEHIVFIRKNNSL